MRMLIASLVLLVVGGCQGVATVAPTPGPEEETPTPMEVLHPTPTSPPPTTTLPPTASPITPSPVPTPVNPACVPEGHPEGWGKVGFDELPMAIADFLNQGASPQALDEALYEADVAGVPAAVKVGDMTGDGKQEVVVAVLQPLADNPLPGGKLLIYVCHQGTYVLDYERDSGEGFGPPHLWYLQDLDADGDAELVVSEATCGAHTCFDEVQILAWEGGVFENRLEGSSLDLPSPDVRLSDTDGDGVYELEVVSSGVNSVGAGPQRQVSRVWQRVLESGRWVVGREVLGPAEYRIHVLHDAEAAARERDFEGALVLYQQVVDDATLAAWGDPVEEQTTLGAYARYKMMALYLVVGQPDFAEAVLAALRADFPEGTAQHAYVALAQAYWEAFASGGEGGACAAAMAYAEAHREQVLDPLGLAHFGYANREFVAGDVCP